MITIFRNIFDKQPNYITVEQALARIKSGRSKEAVEAIRSQLDKDRADKLKLNLPSVCFSGKFTNRADDQLEAHSGFIVLDFDEVYDMSEKMAEIASNEFTYAAWVSPRGNGIKVLFRIADGSKHREHFQAIRDMWPEIDKSGINVSRVCFESYDPNIYINEKSKVFTRIKELQSVSKSESISEYSEIFKRILSWLANKGDAFRTGERNSFIFKLASACCRFGVPETESNVAIIREFGTDNTFTEREAERAIKSAYRSNKENFGSATFERDVLIEKVTRKEVEIDPDIFDESIRPKDVIFGEDVKDLALDIYDHGYKNVLGFGIPELDEYFKLKKGEVTGLSGIGNYGKSTFFEFLLIMRAIKYGDKFALFSPEKNSAQSFYHDLVEILLGGDCTPRNPNRKNRSKYEAAYDFVSKHIFYVYPKELAPTPDYIKERFLELIIKEKITGCVIDPFNQLSHDYKSAAGRSDKYLETFLGDCSRFAKTNDIYFTIIMHPKQMKKAPDGKYPAPDYYDLSDGAMWSNKLDNVLVYHRPNHQKDPRSPICELHTKKIKDQKSVGKKGVLTFELNFPIRRYLFNGMDSLQLAANEAKLDFAYRQSEIWQPISGESF